MPLVYGQGASFLGEGEMKFLKKNNGLFYILPSFILILLFSIIPLIMTFYFSFTKYNVVHAPEWVGLKNYRNLFQNSLFKASVKNTIVYTVLVVPLQTLFSLLLADLLAKHFQNRFGNAIRTVLFIPVISSMILVGTVWKFILSTDNGFMNAILSLFHLPRVNWLGTQKTAMISICMTSIWKNVGYFLVIYYAGIMDIPLTYYESARVDGASKLQELLYITLPCLKPITYLVVTLGTIWSFQVFDLVYSMTGGGPGRSTLTLVLIIYQYAFKQYKMGYACAVSFALFLLVLLVSAIQKTAFREEKEA